MSQTPEPEPWRGWPWIAALAGLSTALACLHFDTLRDAREPVRSASLNGLAIAGLVFIIGWLDWSSLRPAPRRRPPGAAQERRIARDLRIEADGRTLRSFGFAGLALLALGGLAIVLLLLADVVVLWVGNAGWRHLLPAVVLVVILSCVFFGPLRALLRALGLLRRG
jgi:Na+-transporting NADH:ubiquinone oxidoreductase subunit NqrB